MTLLLADGGATLLALWGLASILLGAASIADGCSKIAESQED